MLAQVWNIEEKLPRPDVSIASIRDFRTAPGGTLDAACVADQPNITLYCLDDAHRQAVFVETPPDVDLLAHPFYYQAQFLNATRVLTVPYETLHTLADAVAGRMQKLILLYSVGRCGSTLLSRAFNRVDTVMDLSEPDAYTHVVALRAEDGSRDAELAQLLRSSARLQFKAAGGRTTLAIKFRPYCIQIADLFYKAVPEAKLLFLYRNARDWAQSWAKAFDPTMSSDIVAKTLEENPAFLGRAIPLAPEQIRRHVRGSLGPKDYAALGALALARRVPLIRERVPSPQKYLEPHIRSFPYASGLAVQWLSVMQRYLELHAQGTQMMALRYETLAAEPLASLRAVFEHCDVPFDQLPAAVEAFGHDSQAGSSLARKNLAGQRGLNEQDLSQFRRVLGEHPTIQTPDYVVPNTLTV